MRRVIAALVVAASLALVTYAWAQSAQTINQWNSASTLTGTELVPLCQGCNSATPAVSALLSTVKAFIVASGTCTTTGTAGAYLYNSGTGGCVSSTTLSSNGSFDTETNTFKINFPSIPVAAVTTGGTVGLWLNESFTGSGCGATQCQGNFINITSDNAVLSSAANLASVLQMTYAFGGSGTMVGSRQGINVNARLTSTSGNGAGTFPSYGAVGGLAEIDVNDNGTGLTSTTANGQALGANFIGWLGTNATNIWEVGAAEFNTNLVSGSSVYRKVGVAVGQLAGDSVQGTLDDAALFFLNQSGAIGWKNGIQFGGDSGQSTASFPVTSSGTLIACGTDCSGTTVANIINLSALTVSGNSLQLPGNFIVTGAGALGIGGTPSWPLEVQNTTTVTSGTLFEQFNQYNINLSGASTANYYGARFEPLNNNAQNITGTVIGVNGIPVNNNTGTVTSLYGVQGVAFNGSSGTITNARAIDASLNAAQGGTITAGTGYFAETPTGATTAKTTTWTNISGIEIQDQNPSGAGTNTLTNPPAAIKIDSQTASNAFAINQVGSGISQFAGTVNITGVLETAEVLGAVTSQAGTTYTFAATDCGTEVRFTSASAVTATIPATLTTGCNIAVAQIGAGKVSVNGSAVSPATLHSAHSYTGTFGQFAIIGINIDQTGDAILTGDGS